MNNKGDVESIYILGSGGHAKVILDILLTQKAKVLGLLDIAKNVNARSIWGIEILPEEIAFSLNPSSFLLVNGVGGGANLEHRCNLYKRFRERSFDFYSVIAPSAVVSLRSKLGKGIQVLQRAIVQASCEIGENVIINTGASVDHDCRIADHVHVAPGAILCGDVNIGERSFVGAGAIIFPGICVGENAIIGAGAVVRKNIGDNQVIVGNPGRLKSKKE